MAITRGSIPKQIEGKMRGARDEKEKKLKKSKKQSKDGIRIREVLGKTKLTDAIKSAINDYEKKQNNN